eukprot:TRINITY_DN2817_c0_g1_i3.p2 TRINITY_DN2817_c0_g1~~TRINITY_DN2817_c0_g1_i3.p2  ORF type:complete len:183 (-),score=41.59 TRINITY_DN2817_c0_g1_i3:95-568(-)
MCIRDRSEDVPQKQVKRGNSSNYGGSDHEDHGAANNAHVNTSMTRSQPAEAPAVGLQGQRSQPAIKQDHRGYINRAHNNEQTRSGAFKEYFTKRKLEEAKEKAQMYNDDMIKQYYFNKEDEDEEMNFIELCDTLATGEFKVEEEAMDQMLLLSTSRF